MAQRLCRDDQELLQTRRAIVLVEDRARSPLENVEPSSVAGIVDAGTTNLLGPGSRGAITNTRGTRVLAIRYASCARVWQCSPRRAPRFMSRRLTMKPSPVTQQRNEQLSFWRLRRTPHSSMEENFPPGIL